LCAGLEISLVRLERTKLLIGSRDDFQLELNGTLTNGKKGTDEMMWRQR
jgi:hypothetical protein